MIDFYISKALYNEYKDNENLRRFMNNKSVQVYYVNDTTRPSDDTPKPICGDPNPLRDGSNMLECLLSRKKIKEGLSKAIFCLKDQKKAKIIQDKYGVLCLSPGDLNVLKTKTQLCVKQGDKERKWSFLFEPFEKKKMPCFSIIFADRYLFDNESKYKDIDFRFYNIIEIISNYIKCSKRIGKLHILIIVGKEECSECDISKFEEKIQCINKKINKKIGEIQYDKNIFVEYICCDKKCGDQKGVSDESDKLYYHIHDRNVFSNYLNISATKNIAIFGKEDKEAPIKVSDTQTIRVSAPFPDGFENSNYIESEEAIQDKYIDLLVSDFRDGTTTTIIDGNNRRRYLAFKFSPGKAPEPINNGEKVPILNGLIWDRIHFHVDEPCSCLVVPGKDQWKDITIGYTTYGFHCKNYIVRKETKCLKTFKKKIAELFSGKKITENLKEYYKIVTDGEYEIMTLHVVKVTVSPKPSPRDCKGNCFATEEDANECLKIIKGILGIE